MRNIRRASHCCFWALLTLRALAIEPGNAPALKTYETGIGGSTYIALNDGNTIQLNTSTKLRTLVVGTPNVVAINGGEAFFHVGNSPLEVVAHTVLVNGTETSFSIRDYGDGDVDIMPLQGFVHVSPTRAERGSAVLSVNRADRLVHAGEIAMVRSGRVVLRNLGRPGVRRKLMWRFGMLEFVNEKAGDIAAEFNRYSRTKLVIDDPAIGCARIGGRFSVSDMEVFVSTLSRIYEIRVGTRQTPSGPVVHLGGPRKTEGPIRCGRQSNTFPQG
jgi:transmembrane sensor